MRKTFFAVFLATIILVLCACEASDDPPDNSHESEQFSTEISETVSNHSSSEASEEVSAEVSEEISEEASEYLPLYQNIRVNDLGIPSAKRYSHENSAINPWDIIVYKDDLYIGSGDFSSNAGPIDIWKYDSKDKNWVNSGTVPDEEISRFFVINGMLVAPGIDPQESWDYGNIYYTDGTEWAKKRTIPNASHCFDLTYSCGKLFAAIEYEKNQSILYAAVSEDGGDSFEIIPLLKDGAYVSRQDNGFLRDIFTVKDKTFVLAINKDSHYDVYQYEGDRFEYVTTWNEKIKSKGYGNALFKGKVQFKDSLYFTTGILYKCDSLETPRKIDLPNNEIVHDIYEYEGELFVLGIALVNNEYAMTVYKINDSDTIEFEKMLEFSYKIPAVSFAVGKNSFYFGMASPNRKDTNNGRILEVEIINQ